ILPGSLAVILGKEPVRTPFPHVPADLVKAEPVRWKRLHRRCPQITVSPGVPWRKFSLPNVAEMFLAGSQQVVAPRVAFPFEPAPGGVLPLSLRGQSASSPPAIRQSVIVRDVHHRMIIGT